MFQLAKAAESREVEPTVVGDLSKLSNKEKWQVVIFSLYITL